MKNYISRIRVYKYVPLRFGPQVFDYKTSNEVWYEKKEQVFFISHFEFSARKYGYKF